jgi:hypothetical protein
VAGGTPHEAGKSFVINNPQSFSKPSSQSTPQAVFGSGRVETEFTKSGINPGRKSIRQSVCSGGPVKEILPKTDYLVDSTPSGTLGKPKALFEPAPA